MKKLVPIFVFLIVSVAYATTLNLQVASSSDDAYETSTGTISLTQSYNIRPYSAGMRWAGSRFNNVTIPQGSTIVSATTTIRVTITGTLHVIIYGEDADDCGTFTTTTNDISNRSRTTASVEWSQAVTTNNNYTSPSIVSVIQEITDRGGWASGNDMATIMSISSDSDTRSLAQDEGSGNAHKLDIEYTTAVTGRRIHRATFYQ